MRKILGRKFFEQAVKNSIVGFIFSLSFISNATEKYSIPSEQPLRVKFSPPVLNEKKEWVIYSSVENNSSSSIEINQNFLPWASRWSLYLIGISLEARPELLKMANYIDDPRLERIILPTGKFLKGEVKIERFFQNFQEKLQENSICVCIQFSLESLTKGSSTLIEECHLISKSN